MGIVQVMTTLMVVDGFGQGETRTQAVTRRLREELARHHTTVAAVARRLGEVQQKYSRKMTNQTPWDVESLDRFCAAFGGDFNYVVTGVKAVPTPPPPTPPTSGLRIIRTSAAQIRAAQALELRRQPVQHQDRAAS